MKFTVRRSKPLATKHLFHIILFTVIAVGAILIAVMLINNANGQTACFDKLDDYFKFRLENHSGYTAVYPCPELDKSKVPEDESGN